MFFLSVVLRTNLLLIRPRSAARQRVHPEVHREVLQFFVCQPRKLAEEARNQETKAVKSYGRFGTFEPLGPTFCEPLGVTVVTSRSDLRASRHRVPSRIGPFYLRFLRHASFSSFGVHTQLLACRASGVVGTYDNFLHVSRTPPYITVSMGLQHSKAEL